MQDVERILNIDEWQKLQDSLAKVTRMALLTVNYLGVPVTKHSNPCEFCSKVRRNPKLSPYCQKCDSRGGIEAVRLNKPVIYHCYFGIIDMAVPIVVNGVYQGALMAGEVRLDPRDTPHKLEQILHVPESELSPYLATEPYASLHEKMPVLTLSEIEETAGLLQLLCSRISDGSTKGFVNDEYISKKTGKDIRHRDYAVSPPPAEKAPTVSVIGSNSPNRKLADCKNTVLRPAVEYIRAHPKDRLLMCDMASLCHTSESYFSRLFTKEFGESFTDFILHSKVELAKQMLAQSDRNITGIGDELNFSDPGHFIRVFKKYEGVTPSVYRKYVRGKL